MNHNTYKRKPFSPNRQIMTDVLDAASHRHMIHGLIEVDVTHPRQRIQEIKEQTGESLSFTSYIIFFVITQ